MIKFCTSILLVFIGTIGLRAAVPTITEYSTLTPSETGKISYGISIVSQDDELFVGACLANYVDIYKLNGDEYKFSQKIKAPAAAKSFGYIVAVSGDVLAVVASTSKKIFSYKKSEGVWKDELPVDSIVFAQIPNTLSFNGSTLAVSLNSGAVELYSVDNDGHFTDKSNPYKISGITSAAGCFLNGDTLFAVQKTDSIKVYEKSSDAWILKNKFSDGEKTIGTSNITNFAYENGEYLAGNHKAEQIWSFSKVDDEWAMTIIDHPSSYTHADNVGWGRSVCLKDGIMIVSTNNGNYPVYMFKKVDGVWTEYLEANSSLKMGYTMTFNGRFIAVSDNTYSSNQGIVYVFDITKTPNPLAIGSVQQKQNIDMQIYDLQGRPIQNPTRGLYIKNHKLIMIK